MSWFFVFHKRYSKPFVYILVLIITSTLSELEVAVQDYCSKGNGACSEVSEGEGSILSQLVKSERDVTQLLQDGSVLSPYGKTLVLHNVILVAEEQTFIVKTVDRSMMTAEEDDLVSNLLRAWQIKEVADTSHVSCDEEYDVAVAVPVSLQRSYHGLLYLTLLPLYNTLDLHTTPSRLLMPAVLTKELKGLHLHTYTLYDDKGRHLMEMVRRFAGALYYPLPLDVRLRYFKKSVCITQVSLGVPPLTTSPEVTKQFLDYLRNNFNIRRRDEQAGVAILDMYMENADDLLQALKVITNADLFRLDMDGGGNQSLQDTLIDLASYRLVLGVTSDLLSVTSLLPESSTVLHILSCHPHHNNTHCGRLAQQTRVILTAATTVTYKELPPTSLSSDLTRVRVAVSEVADFVKSTLTEET